MYSSRAEPVAVDGQESGFRSQPGRSLRHAFERGVEDVDLVDTCGRYGFDGPRHGLAFDDRPQQLAVAAGHLLGVVEQRVGEIGRKNHGRGENGPRQAAPSGFVASGFGQFGLVG